MYVVCFADTARGEFSAGQHSHTHTESYARDMIMIYSSQFEQWPPCDDSCVELRRAALAHSFTASDNDNDNSRRERSHVKSVSVRRQRDLAAVMSRSSPEPVA